MSFVFICKGKDLLKKLKEIEKKELVDLRNQTSSK